ncbi:MAG: LysR family transcriptional regulator [Lachnospiraceae bacterium]|nr:LysR family transcriptional regulator [Lachnospiraceae bacterium]
MKTGALIVASLNLNQEDRDNEDMAVFLPMQHLDGTTVIKREIFTLRKAGVTPIIVLCGYQQAVLRNHLSHNGVIFYEDEEFEQHSFEETLHIGLAFAGTLCDRVLVIPVEYPSFSRDTVEKLMECTVDTSPVYQGMAGYPQLHVFPKLSGFETADMKTEIPETAGILSETVLENAGAAAISVEDAGILYSLTAEHGLSQVQAYTREQREANALQLKIKVMLSKEEDFFGPGVYQLLRNIDETGSIQAAAGKMQMSYSKCWKMINKVESQMGFRFVDRINGGKHGGSSSLTEDARIFLDRYRALTEDIRRMSQNFFDVYFRDFQ